MASLSLSSSFVLSLLLLTSLATAHTTSLPPSPAPKPPTPTLTPPPRHHHHPKPATPAPAPTPPPAHPPIKPPTQPPAHPPVKPPTKAPVKPPTYPPMVRKNVAIQGVVFCKSCKYRGVDTLMGAAPLAGAVVKLQCNNTKKGVVEQQKTDKNGYFFFKPQKLTTAGSHKCKVFLVSSPVAACDVPTNLHSGAVGAILSRVKPPVDAPKKPLPFELFTVGPFAFEAAKKLPCHY